MVFSDIMSKANITKILTVEKSQFQVLEWEIPDIEQDITYANKTTIYFEN